MNLFKNKNKLDETNPQYWDTGTHVCNPRKKIHKKNWRDAGFGNPTGSSWLDECDPSDELFNRCKYFDEAYASTDHPDLLKNSPLGTRATVYGNPEDIDKETGQPNWKKYPANQDYLELQKKGKLDKEYVLPWKERIATSSCKSKKCDEPAYKVHEIWRFENIKDFLNKCKKKDPTMVPKWSQGISNRTELKIGKETFEELERINKIEASKRAYEPKKWFSIAGNKKTRKTLKDKYVGKVLLVNLPNNSRPRYRWIVKKRHDGRYIARTAKNGILLKDLRKKSKKNYNSEQLLPKNSSFYKGLNKSKKTIKKKKFKNKTKRILR